MESHAAEGRAALAGLPDAQHSDAIRRVESRFRGHAGLALFRRSWLAQDAVRAIVLVHGFGEHSGRYEHVGEWFARRGSAVHAFDLRGHGRSLGRRGHVDSFADYLDDLEIFMETVQEASCGLPVTLVGHSMGGLIVTSYAVERSPNVQSVVTSGAALELSPELSRFRISLARLICKIAPRLAMNAGLDPHAICSDEEVVRRYTEDPLVHGTSSASHSVAMIDQVGRMRGAGVRVEVPMFLAHGAADRLCLASGSTAFHESLPGSVQDARAPRTLLRIYPDNFHEIFNDVDRETVFADVLAWIQCCENDATSGIDQEMAHAK